MKRHALLPLAFLLAACGASPEDKFEQAKRAYADHHYAIAKVNLAGALDGKPGDPEMLALQARTMIALGDGVGAAAAIDRLPPAIASSPAMRELAAEAALLRGEPKIAVETLGDASSAEAHRLRALAAIQSGDIASAGTHFANAAKIGGNARAFADLARYRLMSGDAAGAATAAEQARQLAPDSLDTLLVLGQLATRRGDLKTALERYSRAAQLYPDNLAPLTGKAAALGDLGRLDEMQAVVRDLAARAPNDHTVLYLRARDAVARKDWPAVRAVIDGYKGPPLDPRDPVRLLFGEALVQLGLHQQAAAQLRPIAASEQGGWTARVLLAKAQLGANDAAGALETMRPIAGAPAAAPADLAVLVDAARAAKDPELPRYEALLRRPAAQALARAIADGDAAMRRSNWGGAAEAYQRALTMTDGDAMILNNMAYAQVMLGNFTAADGFAQRALAKAPDNASVLDTAGWAAVKSGRDVEKGKRLLRQAAEKAPKNPVIQAHLAEAERLGR